MKKIFWAIVIVVFSLYVLATAERMVETHDAFWLLGPIEITYIIALYFSNR